MEVGQFVSEARRNMDIGLEEKYGKNWRRVIYDNIPQDVNKESMYMWLHVNDGLVL